LEITAVTVYNHYYPEASVEMSIAAAEGRRWLTRSFLAESFRIPFIQWNMRRVGVSIAADNAPSIRFAAHLGFIPEGRIREGHSVGVDLLLLGMLKRECKWIGQTNGKALRARCA
jgi:RimJ/RimL family protein N-acetyltransferase